MARPAIHPGEHPAEELKALDMSAAELARQLEALPRLKRRKCRPERQPAHA